MLWDPHYVGLREELEKVQNRHDAVRFFTSTTVTYRPNEHNSRVPGLLIKSDDRYTKRFRMETTCIAQSQLITCYKSLKGEATLPVDDLVQPGLKYKSRHE